MNFAMFALRFGVYFQIDFQRILSISTATDKQQCLQHHPANEP